MPVVDETFQGAQTAADGDVIYDTEFEFVPGTLWMYYNGMKQRNGTDFTETTNRATTAKRHGFNCAFTPASGDVMVWGYTRVM